MVSECPIRTIMLNSLNCLKIEHVTQVSHVLHKCNRGGYP